MFRVTESAECSNTYDKSMDILLMHGFNNISSIDVIDRIYRIRFCLSNYISSNIVLAFKMCEYGRRRS